MRPERPFAMVDTIRACLKDKPGKPGACRILDPAPNRGLVVDLGSARCHTRDMVSLNRVVMQPASRRMIRALGPQGLDVAEISGKWGKRFNFKSYRQFRFPAYDICARPFAEDGHILDFDLILANQVWEHLDRPYAATRHVHAMLRPGGYFWLAVPFFVPFHAAPYDCSRWSARGLRNLLIEAGFDEARIQAAQWGNAHVARRNLEDVWPPQHDPETDDLTDDPAMPVCAWALAQKL